MAEHATPAAPRKPLLDPSTRIAEILFGLIMVLTFTGSLSVADAGRDDVRLMLLGALGCNIAWGVIDAIFYLIHSLGAQGMGIHALRTLRTASAPGTAQRVIGGMLPPVVASALSTADYDAMRQKLLLLPLPNRPRLDKDDLLAALAIFLLVFITTFPVALPFMFIDQVQLAMRVSNAIAIAMLFAAGYGFARVANYRPLLTGLLMVLVGSVVVSATIALGG